MKKYRPSPKQLNVYGTIMSILLALGATTFVMKFIYDHGDGALPPYAEWSLFFFTAAIIYVSYELFSIKYKLYDWCTKYRNHLQLEREKSALLGLHLALHIELKKYAENAMGFGFQFTDDELPSLDEPLFEKDLAVLWNRAYQDLVDRISQLTEFSPVELEETHLAFAKLQEVIGKIEEVTSKETPAHESVFKSAEIINQTQEILAEVQVLIKKSRDLPTGSHIDTQDER